MGSDEVVKNAEREVVNATIEWSREAPWQHRELTQAEQRLKMAVYMLTKAKSITGQMRAVRPEEK